MKSHYFYYFTHPLVTVSNFNICDHYYNFIPHPLRPLPLPPKVKFLENKIGRYSYKDAGLIFLKKKLENKIH